MPGAEVQQVIGREAEAFEAASFNKKPLRAKIAPSRSLASHLPVAYAYDQNGKLNESILVEQCFPILMFSFSDSNLLGFVIKWANDVDAFYARNLTFPRKQLFVSDPREIISDRDADMLCELGVGITSDTPEHFAKMIA